MVTIPFYKVIEISRRAADKLIQLGKISVNNEVIKNLGYQIPHNAIVKYRRQILKAEKLVYILLNKPARYVTTAKDPEGRKKVTDLIIYEQCPQWVYPVGRLDYHTTGLLLLTNDGEFAQKLAHPAHRVKKNYDIVLNRPLTPPDFRKIQNGIMLEDGIAQVDQRAIIDDNRKKNIGIEIHMGKNSVITRIFDKQKKKGYIFLPLNGFFDQYNYFNLLNKVMLKENLYI